MDFEKVRTDLVLEMADEDYQIGAIRNEIKRWMQKKESLQYDLDYLIGQFNGTVKSLKDAKQHLVDCQMAHYNHCCRREAIDKIIKLLDEDVIKYSITGD